MSERSIFIAALEKDDATLRAAYLDKACAGDEVLRARIERLLKAHEPADSFLERGPAVQDATENFEPTAESPGTVIGPYKLIEPIGEGGMGSVWMAQQTEPVRRLVAVKLIKAGMDSRHFIARFEAERQALALMDHANIARVLDGGTTSGGRPYFVMDLVKGVSITRYCDLHHLTPRQRLELFIPVCQAVQHAHQKGIIHRDLKPSNVLVALYDGKPVPKIIDFGVAKATGSAAGGLTDMTLVTGFGAIVGTLEYMSPEQAEVNQLDIDTRSDIYSLGVLLYELLAGSPPFSRKELGEAGMLEMLRVIREQEPSKPSTKLSMAEGLPTLAANRGTEPARLTKLVRGELDWIVMKALEKDRNRRYETANGFAMDVERYLADEPVQACPPSATYRLRKFARRNRGGLAVSGLVLFFFMLLGSGAGWVVRDRSARGAELRKSVTAALDRVAELRQRARSGEARAVLEQVRQRLGPSGAEDLRRQVEQAEADLTLVDRLEAARLRASGMAGGKFDSASAAREYAAAFREARIGEETEAAEVVADRIRSSAVREQLVAAVDDWAVRARKEEPARGDWLLAVARAADPDPWRNRFRDAAVRNDRTALERLAGEAKMSELSPQIINALGVLLGGRGADALPLLTAAQRRYPSDFWLNYSLGVALHNAQRYEEAIGYYRAALALRPAASSAYSSLGIALLKKGRQDEGIAEYHKALELDPKNANAHNNLGNALWEKGQVDEAIAEYKKTIELDPKDANAHTNLGLILHENGRLDEAMAEYGKAIELDPKEINAHNYLGQALREKGRADEAIAEYHKAIEINPKDLFVHCNFGNLLWGKGREDEAVAEYRKAVENNPKHVDFHNNLGMALRATGRVDEAIADYRKAIEVDPKNAWVHYDLGIALKAKGDQDGAERAYREAVRLDGEHGERHGAAIDALAGLLLSRGKLKEAIAMYQNIMILDPKDMRAHYHLGIALKANGDMDEAIAAFENVIRRQPDFTAAHFGLASALAEAKQWDRSATTCAAALKRSGTPIRLEPWHEVIRRDEVFARLTAQQPDDRLPWIIRARLHVFERDWKSAAADYAHANELWARVDTAKLLPEGDDLVSYGCMLVLTGDRPGYEQFCKKWADRVGDSPAWAYSLARAWAVSPRPVVPAQQIVERAEKTVQAGRAPRNLHVLSLAHYRTGKFERTIELAEESNTGDWRGGAKALNWVVLAMAHSRLGHVADARKSFDRALTLAVRPGAEQLPGVSWPDMTSHNFAAFELLRREADELINPKSNEKLDTK